MDLAQYEWMLSELLDLYQNYPSEDEIMMQYLLPALCKALAVLKMVSTGFATMGTGGVLEDKCLC